MGINLTSVCYWSAENPFIDIFNSHSPGNHSGKGLDTVTADHWIWIVMAGSKV